MKKYDITIIGGGIAGIYTMYNLKKNNPKLKVLLLEKNDRFGGRIYSFHKKLDGENYIMDLGAGRIGYHHKLMVDLIYELKLEKSIFPISNTENYIEYNKIKNVSNDKSVIKNKCNDLLYNFFNSKQLSSFSREKLQKMYLNELLSKYFSKNIYREIENSFEYNNKLYHLNSSDAINYFKYDYNKDSKFFILKNGFYSIIDKMLKKINKNTKNSKNTKNTKNSKNNNYILKKNTYVNDIIYNIENSNYIINYYNKNNREVNIQSKYIICALPRHNLINFNILNKYHNELNSINEISKVRIFEIYNVNKNNEAWFQNISKTTTNNELQFIIPINSKNGLIMSSYNENISTEKNYWNELYKKNTNYLKTKLNKHLNNIFNIKIPESKYVKFYYWKYGVACWKTHVDSYYMSEKILNLLPNFYICGENYSIYQAWCEGSLLSSQNVLYLLNCKIKNTLHNKTKKKY